MYVNYVIHKKIVTNEQILFNVFTIYGIIKSTAPLQSVLVVYVVLFFSKEGGFILQKRKLRELTLVRMSNECNELFSYIYNLNTTHIYTYLGTHLFHFISNWTYICINRFTENYFF